MKSVEYNRLINWKRQVVDEVIEWAKVANQITDKQRLCDYGAGMEEGWNKCIQLLKLHGFLDVSYKHL